MLCRRSRAFVICFLSHSIQCCAPAIIDALSATTFLTASLSPKRACHRFQFGYFAESHSSGNGAMICSICSSHIKNAKSTYVHLSPTSHPLSDFASALFNTPTTRFISSMYRFRAEGSGSVWKRLNLCYHCLSAWERINRRAD